MAFRMSGEIPTAFAAELMAASKGAGPGCGSATGLLILLISFPLFSCGGRAVWPPPQRLVRKSVINRRRSTGSPSFSALLVTTLSQRNHVCFAEQPHVT